MKMEPFVSGSSNLYLTNTRILFIYYIRTSVIIPNAPLFSASLFLNRKVAAPQVETRKCIKNFSCITQMKLTAIRIAVCFVVDLAKSNFKNNEIATDFVFRAGSLS